MSDTAMKRLMLLPGVGKSIARDLIMLGIRKPEDLRDADPQHLYDCMCEQTCKQVDKCMLYVFRCIVYAVTEPHPKPELLKWWNWKDKNTKK